MRLLERVTRRRSRGIIIVLLGLLLPALIAFLGLCIDVGVVAITRAHLQTVADAGALAGISNWSTWPAFPPATTLPPTWQAPSDKPCFSDGPIPSWARKRCSSTT